MSRGQPSAVVSLLTLGEDRCAVGHERSHRLGDWEGAGRVDEGSLVTRDGGGCGSFRSAAVLARGDGDDACGEASLGVIATGVSNRASGDCCVCCRSLCVVLGWCRVSSGDDSSGRVLSRLGVRLTSRDDSSSRIVSRLSARAGCQRR